MQYTQEKDGAKIVHESVAQTETCEPVPNCPDTRSIDEIKQNIFSAMPSGENNGQNLVVLSDNKLGPLQGRRGLSRTSSRSSGYADSERVEEHYHGGIADPHDQRAFLKRISGSSLNSSFSRDAMESCQTCSLVRDTCHSDETIELWNSVERRGSYEKTICHCKTLKEKFPDEEGLNNKQVICLLKTLLDIKEVDDSEISCPNLVRIVRFFGPVKNDQDNKCILIRHLVDIVKRSLVKCTTNGKSVKQSWFAGNMTREQAEERLKDEKDNTYLVRMSQSGSAEGNFVVSVKDENGIHHFEIEEGLFCVHGVMADAIIAEKCEGNPKESCKSSTLNCHLTFIELEYDSLPSVIEDLKYNSIKDEEEGSEVWCKYICPNLPFNRIMAPYKSTKRH